MYLNLFLTDARLATSERAIRRDVARYLLESAVPAGNA